MLFMQKIERHTCTPKRDGSLAGEERVMRKFIVLSIYHDAKTHPFCRGGGFFLFVCSSSSSEPNLYLSTERLHEGLEITRKSLVCDGSWATKTSIGFWFLVRVIHVAWTRRRIEPTEYPWGGEPFLHVASGFFLTLFCFNFLWWFVRGEGMQEQ